MSSSLGESPSESSFCTRCRKLFSIEGIRQAYRSPGFNHSRVSQNGRLDYNNDCILCWNLDKHIDYVADYSSCATNASFRKGRLYARAYAKGHIQDWNKKLESGMLNSIPGHALDEIIRRNPIWGINFSLHLWMVIQVSTSSCRNTSMITFPWQLKVRLRQFIGL